VSEPTRKRIILTVEIATEDTDPNDPRLLQQVLENFASSARCDYLNGYAHDIDDLYMEPVEIEIEGGPKTEINVHRP
jgi:hypothetical protein